MAVILSDDEAENVASVLRRMAERVDDADDVNMAFVDDRGPNDFANQLEALVDGGNPSVYVPSGRSFPGGLGYVNPHTARTAAAKTGKQGVSEVAVVDPNDTGLDE